jgi:uncharacterized protein YciI
MPERHELLIYEYVEGITEKRAPYREAHLERIARFREDGRLVIAGAVGDPPHGAVIGFRSGAEEFAAEDPYVLAGLVTSRRVEPWMVV